MINLGVELHAKNLASVIGHESRIAHFGSRRHAAAVLRQAGDGVAVAHPYLRAGLNAVEERAVGGDVLKMCAYILAARHRLYLTSVFKCHKLGAIADSKHGYGGKNGVEIDVGRVFGIYTQRAAREYDADDTLGGFPPVRVLVVGDDFAVDAQFADTASDELGGLRPEIKNDNLLLHLFMV